MAKKVAISVILTLYVIVFLVALENGPLVSLQSLLLGIIGMIAIVITLSSLAEKINMVDISDGFRKKHKGRVPLIGGIALYISIAYGAIIFGVDSFPKIILISLVPIMLVSIIDDIRGAPISFRIVAQIISSWIVILLSDVYLRDLGSIFSSDIFLLNQFGILFTIFAVVGMTNAFNMLDGMDGILGVVSIIILLGISTLKILSGQSFTWEFIILIGLSIFLLFNLGIFSNKYKIFLGDHGSVTIGHILSWNLVFLSQEPNNIISPASALWFVLLPLLDSLLTFYRRHSSQKPIFFADRNHFHHWLSDRGLSSNKVLLIVSIVTLIGVGLAVIFNILNVLETLIFYSFITILISLIILDKHR